MFGDSELNWNGLVGMDMEFSWTCLEVGGKRKGLGNLWTVAGTLLRVHTKVELEGAATPFLVILKRAYTNEDHRDYFGKLETLNYLLKLPS